MIVSILNQKGGVGKTTLTVNLARAFHRLNHSVLVIDSDPQGSASNWHAKSNGELLNIVGLSRPTIHKDIKSIKYGYDFVFIDGASKVSEVSKSALLCSDIILIPVQPSPLDIWSTIDLVELAKTRIEVTENKVKAAFIVSRKIPNTKVGKEMREILRELELPVFENGTSQRIHYSNSVNEGTTVVDLRTDKEATSEIENIAIELKEFIHVH